MADGHSPIYSTSILKNICNLQAEAAVEQTVGNEQYKKKRTVVHLVYLKSIPSEWWLGSRVVRVLDSGAEGPGFKSQSRRCPVTVLGKLFTAVLRVAGVTGGLAKSNGSLPPGL